MVAQQILVLLVWVRVLAEQPLKEILAEFIDKDFFFVNQDEMTMIVTKKASYLDAFLF